MRVGYRLINQVVMLAVRTTGGRSLLILATPTTSVMSTATAVPTTTTLATLMASASASVIK